MRSCASKLEIEGEAKVGRELEIDLARDQGPQFLLVAIQGVDRRGRVPAAERHHGNDRDLEVRRHPHDGNRDRMALQRVVEHVAARENLGHGVADQFADPFEAMGRRSGTSERTGTSDATWRFLRTERRSWVARANRREGSDRRQSRREAGQGGERERIARPPLDD